MGRVKPDNAPFLLLDQLRAQSNELAEIRLAVVNSRLQLTSLEKRVRGIAILVWAVFLLLCLGYCSQIVGFLG